MTAPASETSQPGSSLRGTTLAIAATLAFAASAVAAGPANRDAATGYRIANYRAPVDLLPEGGDRVDLAAVDKLRKDGAVLVDVMPARAGYDAKDGKWLLVEKRMDIPESTWLPNVGMGKLQPRLAAFFEASMRRLTSGDKAKPVVFYCMADCWMSWNAVKRAASLGYSHAHWFAEGTDGWAEAGRDLVEATPPPVPDLTPAAQN